MNSILRWKRKEENENWAVIISTFLVEEEGCFPAPYCCGKLSSSLCWIMSVEMKSEKMTIPLFGNVNILKMDILCWLKTSGT